MQILSRDEYSKLLESIKVSAGDFVFIHHNITGDLVTAQVKKVNRDNVVVCMPNGSAYAGQPDFTVKKTAIIGQKR